MMHLKAELQRFTSLGVSLDHHGVTLRDTRMWAKEQNVKIVLVTFLVQTRKQAVSQCCIFSRLTCPPAAQAATSPYWPPSFCSRCATVVTSLQPVAPNGWPRDREPPHRLNLSMGGVPTYTHTQEVFPPVFLWVKPTLNTQRSGAVTTTTFNLLETIFTVSYCTVN